LRSPRLAAYNALENGRSQASLRSVARAVQRERCTHATRRRIRRSTACKRRRRQRDAGYGRIMNLCRRGSGEQRKQRTSDLPHPVQCGHRQAKLLDLYSFDGVGRVSCVLPSDEYGNRVPMRSVGAWRRMRRTRMYNSRTNTDIFGAAIRAC
jgi:hypothetical protein